MMVSQSGTVLASVQQRRLISGAAEVGKRSFVVRRCVPAYPWQHEARDAPFGLANKSLLFTYKEQTSIDLSAK